MKPPGERVTLLVVEDDDIAYLKGKRSFKSVGLANPVVRAVDGRDALDMLINRDVREPLTVLLDLQLPRMNGFEFLEELRRTPGLEDTVVFVLSTSSDERDIEQSFRHKVAGYLVKEQIGAGVSEMVSLLDTYWRHSRLPGDAAPQPSLH